jgi:heparan-alpha-glucosaminide N-acetyltransferase
MQQLNYAPAILVNEPGVRPATPRALSVDVLRGLVMFAMVFVNDLAGGRGVPWWMKHYPGNKSGMTFVDVVFPAFLFIVGMSIPLAVEGRRAKRESWLKIYGHVILRTLGLLAIGVLMVNGEDEHTGWRDGLWATLMFGGVILAFHSVRLTKPALRYASLVIRILGAALLVFLAWRFRGAKGARLDTSWWGILGLIGWAYFVATTAYLLLRKESSAALVGAAAVLMCMYFADKAGAFRHFAIPLGFHTFHPSSVVSFGETLGSQAAISMLGVAIGATLLPRSVIGTPIERVRYSAVLLVLMALGALLLHKTFGINKNSATPSWCLWSAAITTALWIVLYWVVDVMGWRTWSLPFAWAGANALLLYILSEMFGGLTGLIGWDQYDRWGASFPMVAYRSLALAAALALFAGLIGKLGFRLRL